MKSHVLLIALSLLTTPLSHAIELEEGGVSGGGGDIATEGRINEIRADLLSWIGNGGAAGLKLPAGTVLTDYNAQMTAYLMPQYVVVGSVTTAEEEKTQDPERKVSIEGESKTCRGFVSTRDGKPHVLCNVERFKETLPDDQYPLIHHEYAGLARLEKNIGPASDYRLSNQITGFLETQMVRKMAIKKHSLKNIRIVESDGSIRFWCWAQDSNATVGMTYSKKTGWKDLSFRNPGKVIGYVAEHSKTTGALIQETIAMRNEFERESDADYLCQDRGDDHCDGVEDYASEWTQDDVLTINHVHGTAKVTSTRVGWEEGGTSAMPRTPFYLVITSACNE